MQKFKESKKHQSNNAFAVRTPVDFVMILVVYLRAWIPVLRSSMARKYRSRMQQHQ